MNTWRPLHSVILLLGATLVSVWLPSATHGQNSSWVQPLGGLYEDPGNWVPGTEPPITNNLIIGVAGAYNIGLASSHTANDLTIANNVDLTLTSVGGGDPQYLFSLAGAASISSSSLTLGDLSQGSLLDVDIERGFTATASDLTLLNGAQLTTSSSGSFQSVLDAAGATRSQAFVGGTSSLGEPSRWQMAGSLRVGDSGGAATLTIADGGQVLPDSLHVAAVVAADGSLVDIQGAAAGGEPSTLSTGTFNVGFLTAGGELAKGTVNIVDGATMSSGSVQVRKDSRITIKGEDSSGNPASWQAGQFSLNGGFLDILQGGQVSTDSVNLDRLAIAKVEGTSTRREPSTWDIAGNLRLGSVAGFGSLLVDQGEVTADTVQIGVGIGSSLLSVEGQAGSVGLLQATGHVSVGGSLNEAEAEASGELRLNNDHALVDIGGTLTIWGPGTVTLNGGTLRAIAVDHTHGGTLQTSGGRLSVDSFAGNLVNNSFTLAPGDPTGGTLIDGNYTQQSGGELAIDIGGTSFGGTYDSVNVTGDAIVDGLLNITLVNGFTPDASTKFIVMVADSFSGLFDNITTGQRLDTLDGRGSFVVNYGIGSAELENRIVLTDYLSSGVLPGDYNGDDVVDIADYTVWRNNLGAPAGTLANDLHSSVIGTAQYETWKLNFGVSLASPVQAATVPEPSSIVVLGLVLLCSPLSCRAKPAVSFRRRLAD
ncbi:hypothetical protein NG895_08225 [Aeoliella sp. ICT_H6.2]|uniref:Uncharacterized protein n=1 Tax=Aeoliella straminimaris TaxID=2954799 RepID=A0A9X2F7P2_9BACT|nr:hypothetical protein [Aeoliella straminimaris]MCO6043892.1 hypothetical protein [Aeoliella straminimaris]